MPSTPHVEQHFAGGETLRDIVIGMSNGLTVPFALAAGLSGAVGSTHIIVTAGFAEIAAGSIAMGLGGYLAARGDATHYASERRRELAEIAAVPDIEAAEIRTLFADYGLAPAETDSLVAGLRRDPEKWADFMMRFELGLEAPAPGRALRSALTIAGAYIVGGLIPLAAYLILPTPHSALKWSVAATLTSLAIFGAFKARATGTPALRGAWQTTLIGGLAAGAAFAIARLVS